MVAAARLTIRCTTAYRVEGCVQVALQRWLCTEEFKVLPKYGAGNDKPDILHHQGGAD